MSWEATADCSSPLREFDAEVRLNQHRLVSNLRPSYDFVVCGAGSSGSVVARRLAENADAKVLLIEAGGGHDGPSVSDPSLWPTNLGSERDWGFGTLPNPHLNGRSITLSMGKAVGGGSAIDGMIWARGHRSDWDFFADEAGDPAWGYESVLDIYRRMEDYRGAPDPRYRGTGGPVFVQPAPDPHPLVPATLSAAEACGIPTFESPNGRMMEAAGGAAITDLRVRNGKRESVFHSYTYPYMTCPNLTVLTGAHVTRIITANDRAIAVEVVRGSSTYVFAVEQEIVLSMGAVQTPKVLMLSGIGDEATLRSAGIAVYQHLPGVGNNLQDHVCLGTVLEGSEPLPPRNNLGGATAYSSVLSSKIPDIFICQAEVAMASDETAARFGLPQSGGWTLAGGISHPKSRGSVRLSGPNPQDPVEIATNALADPDDLKTAIACIEVCRDIANAAPLRPFVRREVMPGNLKGTELERFVREAATTHWHPCGTAKMGPIDRLSVVDGALKVYGFENLRIADASIMPRVTVGNTMAPCVIIGERAAEMIKAEHSL
jgi:choline dehydrogenase